MRVIIETTIFSLLMGWVMGLSFLSDLAVCRVKIPFIFDYVNPFSPNIQLILTNSLKELAERMSSKIKAFSLAYLTFVDSIGLIIS